MTNAFKIYMHGGKYRIIDENEFIATAKDKITHDNILKKRYGNKEIHKLNAVQIFKELKIKMQPVNALLIKINESAYPLLKTIEMMEEDIETYIFKQIKENSETFSPYLKGSKGALIEILEKDLNYKVEEERTLEDFVDKEVYTPTNITYKDNKITIDLTKDKFICDLMTQRIYKYKSTILNTEGYQFNFKKNELFESREAAIAQSKKLVNEHYNLPIRNGKVQKIIVRTDSLNHLIVFWPDIPTDNDYIMANDVIGPSDLAGDTKTSLIFFNECKDATPSQVKMARDTIENCMNLQTMNVRHL